MKQELAVTVSFQIEVATTKIVKVKRCPLPLGVYSRGSAVGTVSVFFVSVNMTPMFKRNVIKTLLIKGVKMQLKIARIWGIIDIFGW